MMTRASRMIALVAGLAVASSGCQSERPGVVGGPGFNEPMVAPHPQVRTTEPQSLIAESTVRRVPVFERPGAARPFVTFEHPLQKGVPRVFLVRRVQGGWLRVFLPMRPNGATGWIRAGDTDLARTSYHLLVDTSANRLTVFDGDAVIREEPVAVGTGGTPTPIGDFYITMLVRPPDPVGAYGPYAYGLSAYSEVLNTFAGGDGQVAIHGTNDPSSIGQPVSHGCIRMDNEAISRLTRVLPLGTPVTIRR